MRHDHERGLNWLPYRTICAHRLVLIIDHGIAGDCDAIVELTAADVAAGNSPATVSGDPEAYHALRGVLDLENHAFYMHQR